MERQENWLRWAVELQSLAQAGLYYGKDPFDRERYARIREIAAEMLQEPSGLPLETVKDLFCCESGYQTPKLDTRAAIFRDGRILLVQERNGTWSLPGGWVDVDLSVAENAAKEVLEEAGLELCMNLPGIAFYGIYKFVFYCILPYGIMATLPVQSLIGEMGWGTAAFGIGVVCAFSGLTALVWRNGMRHYNSASS